MAMSRPEPLKYFTILTGKEKGADVDFVRMLHERRPRMQEVSKVKECDVVFAFCPVVSRAGSDIEAALIRLNNESANKPVVLVVLFHTLNPEFVVPDSSKSVNRANTFTVDCVFHEDQQLWKCNTNYDAIAKVTEHLKSEVENGENGWSIMRFTKPITRGDSARRPLLETNTGRNGVEEYSDNSSCCRCCCRIS